jgi:uncharacterized protein YbgA (DUF1722 family)/uncharacterized protein YbbK (DUF523 family)
MSPPSLGSWKHWHDAAPPRLGISACLLGQAVRFDGGHKRDRFCVEDLGPWVEWVPVCPEVEAGMPVPRPSLRLVETPGSLRLIAPKTGDDWTEALERFSAARVRQLARRELDGYVLKKDSPSCGMERVKVYGASGRLHSCGTGVFAAALERELPTLPLEEEGRLNDPRLRENFIERIFCRQRWRVFLREGATRRRLVEFHTAHKLLLRAHGEAGYQRLGRLVGSAGTLRDDALVHAYGEELHRTLRALTTVKRHANVLQHAMGYLKRLLAPGDKQEILTAIDDYRAGMLPLVVPLTLIRYNLRRFGVEYLLGQLYFDPHPKELMLRNHA